MRIIARITVCVLILLLIGRGPGLARAQPQGAVPSTIKEKQQEKEGDREIEPGDSWSRTPETMERDLQYRAALELRQTEHRKALEAVEQILTLARRLKKSTGSGERINVAETLETIQKQAKRIRSFSGGGESDQQLKNRPSSLEAGATQIIALAEELKRRIETLDHRVMSVIIIDGSNAIIQLSDYLRERGR